MSDDEDVGFYDSDGLAVVDDFDDDEDDAALATRNEKGKSADSTVSHKSFSPAGLRAEIDREVEGVVSVLGVDRGLALVFLLHYRWNRDRLVELYADSPMRVLGAVGEVQADHAMEAESNRAKTPPKKRLRRCASPPPENDSVCRVCFDDLSEPSDVPAMRCKHRFCRDCWGHYLSTKVKDEGQCSVRCMAETCNTMLTDDFIKAVVDSEVYDRWHTLLAQSFVSATPSLRFCPAPSCMESVQCSIGSSGLLTTVPTVTCSKGHLFCFGCGLANGHTPVICKIANLWVESKDSGTTQWINANTRKCPKCSNNIEKAGGCNRILCRHCQFQFCWVCLKSWDVHGYNDSVCNSYVEPPRTATMDEAKVNLERWLFYYDRFDNHVLSARLDQELVERTQEKMVEIQKTSELSWIQTRFMQHAVDELTKCRLTLKWTYAMAHFLSSGNKKQMFEDIQADLEKAVEQLSQLIDEPIEDASVKALRQKVMDKTTYVQKRHEVMLKDVAKGLADGHWDWTIPLD